MKWSERSFLHFSSLSALALVSATIFISCRSPDESPRDAGSPTTTETAPPAHSTASPAEKAIADAGDDASLDAAVLAASLLDASAETDAGPPPACPPEMVHIGRYCVDRWEGHFLTKNDDGTTTPWPHYERPKDDTYYIAHSAAGAFPQAYVSRVEAKAACTHAGKRLCSRAEWMRACKGNNGYRYPYGNKGKRGACNTGKPHLLHTFFGPRPGGWTYDNFNDPKLNQEPGFLAKSSEYETCHSTEDVYDMVGNLHEWVNDTVGTDIEEVLAKDGVERKTQPWKAGNAMFMGGFFSTTIEHGPGCTYTTIAHEPTYHDYSTGFRCCKTAVLPAKPAKSKPKK